MEICSAYISKINSSFDKKIIISTNPNEEKEDCNGNEEKKTTHITMRKDLKK